MTSALDGLLLVDKPSGPSSYDMIRWVKHNFKGVKIGHCGTLDPLASGLLLLLLGRATRKQAIFMGQDKTYRFVMRCGIKTDSGDVTGKMIQEMAVPLLTQELIDQIFSGFLGNQTQTPPMFSALKKEGVPLYKLARRGQTVFREPRPIKIHSLVRLTFSKGSDIECRVRCSSGTYVRSLVEDMGEKLGTVATMVSLVRESIGSYRLEEAMPGLHLKTFSLDQLQLALRNVS